MESNKPEIPPSVDELVRSTGLSAERVERALTGLKIAERIKKIPIALGCDYRGKHFGAPTLTPSALMVISGTRTVASSLVVPCITAAIPHVLNAILLSTKQNKMWPSMDVVNGFLPITGFMLAWLALHTLCSFAIATYRKRGLPSLDPVMALVGSGACLYLATLKLNDALLMGLLLFGSLFAAFSASVWSLQAMKAAGQQSVNDEILADAE
jgi:hypothetical protein